MTRFMIVVLAAFLVGCCCTPQPPAAPHSTSDRIQKAIDFSVKYLLAHQEIEWPPDRAAQDPAGIRRTAFVTYALLAAGAVSPNDPRLAPILAVLINANNPDPYTRGLRLRIWQLLWQDHHDPKQLRFAAFDAEALLKSVHYAGSFAGVWGASVQPTTRPNSADFAATQSAVAGLRAVDQMGGEIPDASWRRLDECLRTAQLADGSWSGSGTGYELSSLLDVQSVIARNAGLACNGNIKNDAVDAGLAWIGQHFDQFKTTEDYCTLEQIGDATGHRYFGKIDWFATIADRLIKTQLPDGSWAEGDKNPTETLASTAFGLLFLVRGGGPVIFEKLDYSAAGKPVANWNERPSDIPNLTRWIGVEDEAMGPNWQLADLNSSLDDLHAAPILYMAGDQHFDLSDAAVAKLRQFVLEGGLILGNADCASAAFKKSFTNLGDRMFPKYEFMELSRDDIIYTAEAYKPNKMRGHPTILGLTNGVRDLMLLLPTGDPSRSWQANAKFGQRIDDFKIGADIFLYATDELGLRNKADTYIFDLDPSVTPTRTIRLARLMVGDNPDPEPAGWPRLAAILRRAPYKLDLQVSPIKPGDSLAGFQIVHLTGTTAFTLTPVERAALVDFIHRGGTLIIDAAGGSGGAGGAGAFADAAEKELGIMFGNGAPNALAWLPRGSLLYTLPIAPIDRVRYRRFAKRRLVGDSSSPRIQGIQFGGRTAVFFSRLDLSAGLVGESIDGIDGYSPESATDLMRNMILYCATR